MRCLLILMSCSVLLFSSLLAKSIDLTKDEKLPSNQLSSRANAVDEEDFADKLLNLTRADSSMPPPELSNITSSDVDDMSYTGSDKLENGEGVESLESDITKGNESFDSLESDNVDEGGEQKNNDASEPGELRLANRATESDDSNFEGNVAPGVFSYDNAIIISDDGTRTTTFTSLDNADENASADNVATVERKQRAEKERFWAWVALASKGDANLFRNSRRIANVIGGSGLKTFKFRASARDVIGIRAIGPDGYRGGVAAVVRLDTSRGTEYHSTGRSEHFKAVAEHSLRLNDRKFWSRAAFHACRWPRATDIGSNFVWARDETRGKPVLLRFKIGGETCRKAATKFPRRCACRVVMPPTGSQCYAFLNKQKMKDTVGKSGRCKKRACSAKYECIPKRRLPKTVCVRRFSTTEIRIVGRFFRRVCKNVKVPPKPFYVPYQ